MKKNATKSLLPIILLIALLALPVGVRADGGTDENGMTQTVDGYEVTLVFEKPAAVGENQIRVFVKDAMNMPVSQADLEVSLVEAEAEHVEAEDEHAEEQPTAEAETMSGMSDMSAQPTAEIGTMSSMSPAAEGEMAVMSAEPAGHDQMGMVALAAGHETGEYEGEIAIVSDGDQIIRIHLTVNGKLMEVNFPLHVAKSNTGAIVLGSFFAVNIALIAAAIVMKPKSVSVDLSKKA